MAPHTWSHLGDTVSDATHRMYYRGQRIKQAYYRGECVWDEEEQDYYRFNINVYFGTWYQKGVTGYVYNQTVFYDYGRLPMLSEHVSPRCTSAVFSICVPKMAKKISKCAVFIRGTRICVQFLIPSITDFGNQDEFEPVGTDSNYLKLKTESAKRRWIFKIGTAKYTSGGVRSKILDHPQTPFVTDPTLEEQLYKVVSYDGVHYDYDYTNVPIALYPYQNPTNEYERQSAMCCNIYENTGISALIPDKPIEYAYYGNPYRSGYLCIYPSGYNQDFDIIKENQVLDSETTPDECENEAYFRRNDSEHSYEYSYWNNYPYGSGATWGFYQSEDGLKVVASNLGRIYIPPVMAASVGGVVQHYIRAVECSQDTPVELLPPRNDSYGDPIYTWAI